MSSQAATRSAIAGAVEPDEDAMMMIARRTWIVPRLPRRTIRSRLWPSASVSRRAPTDLVMADLTLKPPMIQTKINTSTDRGPRPVSRRPNKRSRPAHSYGVLCCQGACGDLPLGVVRQAVSGGRGCMEAGGRNCPGSGRLTTHGRDSDTRIGYLHDGVFVGNGPLSRKRASPGIPPLWGAGLLIVGSRIVPRAALAGSFSHRPFWGARCRMSRQGGMG